ncbi:MAG TPA: hypothetical protein VJ999_00835 [Candidatus Sulfotelmatobacter sp.]|nr:hypothetical protein [Candidatus Sulfotelmatobacter sp.]
MLTLYRCLLYLYPAIYRREFGEEMTSVFLQAQLAVRNGNLAARVSFCAREIPGLLSGAMLERFHKTTGSYDSMAFRGFNVRPEFQFPRFTVFLMLVILAGVVLSLEKARGIQMKYGAGASLMSVWPALPWALALMLLIVSATVVLVLGLLFALRRTGVHRFANLQPWPERKQADGSDVQV